MTNKPSDRDVVETGGTDDTITEDTKDSLKDSLFPVLWKATVVVVRFLWILGGAVAASAMLAVAVLTDRERQLTARRWLLLEGNRWTIAGGLMASVFAVVLIAGLIDVVGIAEPELITTLFGGIISGLFSFVPIVVAVNQLTISELFGTPARLRERIESVREFRGTVEERLPEVAVGPTDPGAFLAVAARVLSRQAESLRKAGAESGDTVLWERIDKYVDEVVGQTEQLKSRTDGEDEPLIEVLLLIMNDDYATKINAARRIQSEWAHTLTAGADDLLDDLREIYVDMSILRQYYKAIYLQQELAKLSRYIVYTGLSSFLVSALLILTFADGTPPDGHGLGMLMFVSTALAIAFSPFAVLFSFVLRIATIAKRTAAPGAFTPRAEMLAPVRKSTDSESESTISDC